MIIPDDTPQTPKTQPNPAPVVEQAPPPAYPGYDVNIEAGTSTASRPLLGSAPVVVAQGEPAGKRFLKAFCVAVVVWGLFAALTSSLVEVGRGVGLGHREWEDAASAWPVPEDGKVLHCIKGQHGWSQSPAGDKIVSFEIPRELDVLYLFKRGMMSSGNVVITQDERIHEPDTVHIDITALHHTPDYLHAIAVCSMERKSGEQGVGIFTPKRWRTGTKILPDLEFEVTIRLPKLSYHDPLQVDALETDMPNFSHHIGDLASSVNFQSLAISGTNAHIYAESVNVTGGALETSNSHIRGKFECSGLISLRTSNAQIDAAVKLTQGDAVSTSVLDFRTSNGRVSLAVDLVSAESTGGDFAIQGRTSNARMKLDVLSLPPEASLGLQANSSNAAVAVTVPSTFEGSYTIQTTGNIVNLTVDPEDPSGQGRKRKIWQFRSKPSEVGGTTTWGGKHPGNILVRTSNSPAHLRL